MGIPPPPGFHRTIESIFLWIKVFWATQPPIQRKTSRRRKSKWFPRGSDSKESACIVGDLGSVPGLGRSPGEGNGKPLSILAWKSHVWSLVGYSPWGCKESGHGFPHSSVGKESTCNAGDPGLVPGSARSAGEGNRLPTPVCLGFPGGSGGKESAYSSGDLGSIPGLRRSPGEGNGYPLQYSGLENSMDCIVCGVAKSRIWLSNFHFTSEENLLNS